MIGWRPITEERFDEKLDLVPPAYQNHRGFLFGEPMQPGLWQAFVRVDGAFYESACGVSLGEFLTLTDMQILGNPAP